MTTSRIIWTTLEQQRLAAWCAQRVALRLNVDVTDLTRETLRKHYGFFTDVFECAQQEVFKQSPERIRPFIRTHRKVSWLLDAMVSFVQKQQLKQYAKQDRAGEDPARTVALSAQDLSKLCDMVAENVVKQLATRYGLRPWEPMSYAEQLPEHYARFIAGGNRAEDFDRLLTHAPTLLLLQNSQEQITQGYMADSLTSNDPAFMWGYANRLRDKGQLPNHFDAPDDDACNAVFKVLVQFLSLSK